MRSSVIRHQRLAAASVISLALIGGSASAQVTGNAVLPNGQPDLSVKGPPIAPGLGQVFIPNSSKVNASDIGKRARTHYKVFVPAVRSNVSPNGGAARPSVVGGPPFMGYYSETPASLACIYGFAPPAAGCNPETLTSGGNATGGSRAIALIDAYDNPSAATDLQNYSTQFGLPAINSTNFQVVYASGTQPANNTGWALEEALDIEMAHAMAPSAKIYLVEAASNSYDDLNIAIDKAVQLLQAAGGGELSMSYGGSEFSGETSYDTHFTQKTGITFFASTGDEPGTEYPSVSPKVVAVGGTNTSRRNDNRVSGQFGFYTSETAWHNTGGGVSPYEPAAAAQSAITSRLGDSSGQRAVPDVSADASEYTYVWVTCGSGCGYSNGQWLQVYGTSVASPLVAAMANNAGKFLTGGQELSLIYSRIGTSDFFDITSGTCGTFAGYSATAYNSSNPAQQYDYCTGIGSPRGRGGL